MKKLLVVCLLLIPLSCLSSVRMKTGDMPTETIGAKDVVNQPAQQQGGVNLANLLSGINIQPSLPAGFFTFMVIQTYLSHRREMTRLKMNGKHGLQVIRLVVVRESSDLETAA